MKHCYMVFPSASVVMTTLQQGTPSLFPTQPSWKELRQPFTVVTDLVKARDQDTPLREEMTFEESFELLRNRTMQRTFCYGYLRRDLH
jgi:hypothetical protein